MSLEGNPPTAVCIHPTLTLLSAASLLMASRGIGNNRASGALGLGGPAPPELVFWSVNWGS